MFARVLRVGKCLLQYKFRVLTIIFVGFFFGLINAALAGLGGFIISVVSWVPEDGSILKLLPKYITDLDFLNLPLLIESYKSDTLQQGLFIITLGLFAILMVLMAATIFFQNYLPEWLSYRVTVDLRNQLAEHMMTLDFSFFQEKRSGELISRLTNDLHQLSQCLLLIGIYATRPFALMVLLVYLFHLDWQLALLGLGGVPLAALALKKLFKKMRLTSRVTQERQADVTDSMVQFLSGMSTVKAFDCQDFELATFRNENEGFFKATAKCARARCGERPVTSLTGKFGVLLVLYFGGMWVMQKSLSPEVIVQFIATLLFIYNPAKELSRANSNMQVNLAGAERVFDILETEAEIVEGTESLDKFRKTLEFKNVSFEYVHDSPVIKNFNLKINRGETIAFVGPSGAGKSTLINLLLRLYDINDGEILLDGISLADLTFSSLREKMGLVSQQPFLFNCSVRDNIAYGLKDAKIEDIITSAKAANIHEEILALPSGYDTLVGDRGDNLSGGQRQRLAIARAVFKNPPILLLDEATSALDSENERKVQDALDKLMASRTSIVIAHRLSTIRNADRIVMLSEGEILGCAPHEELIKSCPEYANLVSLQNC